MSMSMYLTANTALPSWIYYIVSFDSNRVYTVSKC